MAILTFLSLAVVQMLLLWKIPFRYSRHGWMAIIPVYNLYTLLKLAGKPLDWLVWIYTPLANVFFIAWMYTILRRNVKS